MLWRLFLTCPGCGLSAKKARSYVLRDSCFIKAFFPRSILFPLDVLLQTLFTTGALPWFAKGANLQFPENRCSKSKPLTRNLYKVPFCIFLAWPNLPPKMRSGIAEPEAADLAA